MKAWRFILLALLLASACTPAAPLPAGITRIKGIDHQGLDYPLWSPDGRKIAAAYNIEPMADIAGLFGPKPRNDIVVIDTDIWQTSIVAGANRIARVFPEAWLPDNKRLAVGLPGGSDTDEIYVIDGDRPRPNSSSSSSGATYLSPVGALSPDLKRIASYDAPFIKISNIDGRDTRQYEVPSYGYWYPFRWSANGQWLTLLESIWNENEHTRNAFLLYVDAGTFIRIDSESGLSQFSPQISPSGELIAYVTSGFVESDLVHKLIISRLDHHCRWTMPLDDPTDFAWSPDGSKMFIVGFDGVYLADLGVVFGSSYPSGQGCK